MIGGARAGGGTAARAGALLVLGALAASCAEPAPRCDAPAVAALTLADRKLIGAASPYPADGLLRGRERTLATSMAARRAAAWAAVARALEPVPFAVDPPSDVPARLPRWQTWYGKDDINRMFQRLFRGLAADDRRARAPFTDAALDDAFAWNPHAVEEAATWPEERWRAYLAGLDSAGEIAGVGGIDRVGYSPGAVRHLFRSYGPILGCMAPGGPPPPLVDAPTAGPVRLAHQAMELGACEQRSFGPYFVGDGESLTATVDGAATVQLRAGGPTADVAPPPTGEPACDDAVCTTTGPAAVWLTVVASERGPAALTVDYREADPSWAPCLTSAFPLDAAVIKADWRRAELGVLVPRHDTSAAGLARMIGAEGTWIADGDELDPGPDQIYSLTLPNGARYRLTGLHLMTKELDHWLWITLWWSDDPDHDFGADRPEAISALPGPWRHYKMAVATMFRDEDLDPAGGATDPTLAAALGQVYSGGGASWASNPYIELGHGNGQSNCIGCHQHGGTALDSATIIGDEARFPDHGRVQQRNNFPSDYSWAVTQGDRLGRLFADEVEFSTPAP